MLIVCWAPEVFEACPCNILHSFNLRDFFFFLKLFSFSVCVLLSRDWIHRGGWCDHMHTRTIFFGCYLIHAGLWRPGSSLIFCLGMWMISYVHPSKALHPKPRVTLFSLAHSCTLYEWCHALYAFPEVCRDSWLCLVVLVKAWGVLDWRHCFPANNCCLNVNNSHNNCCRVNVKILHTSLSARSALIHPVCFLFFLSHYISP